MIKPVLTTVLFLMTSGCVHSPERAVLFEEHFQNLANWHLEGKTDGASLVDGQLRLDCKSKMGYHGVMAFCKRDFPDNIAIDFDFVSEKHNGLFIAFIAMT